MVTREELREELRDLKAGIGEMIAPLERRVTRLEEGERRTLLRLGKFAVISTLVLGAVGALVGLSLGGLI